MFDKLIWRQDRMILDDLVFRLEHYRNDDWELGDNCLIFYKTKPMTDLYGEFWSLRKDFRPQNILELGMWDGGSVVFWFEYFQPQKHIGIDIQPKQDSRYFKQYITSKGLTDRIKTYWSTNQADSAGLREIINKEFSGPLDLVIDDASHMYELTKKSFETLFPLLRPGGLYVIEDWPWGHWKKFQASDHPWAAEVELTKLIFELVEAAGSSPALIANITITGGFAVVERGKIEAATLNEFEIEKFITRRPHNFQSQGKDEVQKVG